MAYIDQQLEAIGGLAQARLNRGAPAGDALANCRAVLVGRLAAAPPRGTHPFIEMLRNGETFQVYGARMHVKRMVEVTLRYFLGPLARAEIGDSFPRLTAAVGQILEAIQKGSDENWHSDAEPPVPYTLAEHGLITSIRPVRCIYAFAEAGEGGSIIHPAVVMTYEIHHDLQAYSTDVEPLTRINVDLHLDGAAPGESGYDIGKLIAVTGVEPP